MKALNFLVRVTRNTLLALCVAISSGTFFMPTVGHANGYTFEGVDLLVQTAAKQAKQVKSRLVLSEGRLIVADRDSNALLNRMEYSDIQAATYSRSKHPRWKTGLGLAIATGVFAIPVFFMKTKKHWLTFQGSEEFIALRLSKKNFATVLSAVEVQTGIKIERINQ